MIEIICAGIIALMFGSFLNVVIYRYPKMLHASWKRECENYLTTKQTEAVKLNLAIPRSHCIHCKKPLTFWQNIPLLSFIFLKRQCGHCKGKISFTYFFVELLTMLLTMSIFYDWGFSLKAFAAVLLTWNLITLAVIDFQHRLLPDAMTLGFLWLGLILNSYSVFTTPQSAILGAVVAYCSLWLIANLFQVLRKKPGMGHGDFKMLAMFGAWLGFPAVLNVLLLAVFLGSIVSIFLLLIKKIKVESAIPFGPFIAVAGWITMLFGSQILNWTFR
jgi:leader peptidase (prepilin peptidase)/N-methyltransferase